MQSERKEHRGLPHVHLTPNSASPALLRSRPLSQPLRLAPPVVSFSAVLVLAPCSPSGGPGPPKCSMVSGRLLGGLSRVTWFAKDILGSEHGAQAAYPPRMLRNSSSLVSEASPGSKGFCIAGLWDTELHPEVGGAARKLHARKITRWKTAVLNGLDGLVNSPFGQFLAPKDSRRAYELLELLARDPITPSEVFADLLSSPDRVYAMAARCPQTAPATAPRCPRSPCAARTL